MLTQLTSHEARVLGSLIEKQITTPDQYPLSLNALTNACNQKSNRDPVMELDERTVQEIVDGLMKKHLLIEKSGFGSRVPKYQHVFLQTEFGPKFSPQEIAIVVELLLRGPQTPGELRSRANRMCTLHDVSEIEAALTHLLEREDGPFVARLPREPGRRDARYAQLFTGPVATETVAVNAPAADSHNEPIATRISRLEALVEELRLEVETLKQRS
jgi:uncharacterized protein YceH (UPF0502 family)